MKDDVEAPVEKGDVVGTYRIYVADELVNEVDLIAGEDVKTGWLPSYLGISNMTTVIGGTVIGALLILFIWIKVHNARVRRAKKRLHRQMVMEMAMEELRAAADKAHAGGCDLFALRQELHRFHPREYEALQGNLLDAVRIACDIRFETMR